MVPDLLTVASRLGDALDVRVDPGRLSDLDDRLRPELVEWSVNVPRTARGELRVAAWTRDLARARAALEAGSPEAELDDALGAQPDGGDMVGVGLAFGDASPLRRYWRLAPVAAGNRMLAVACEVLPEVGAAARALADVCGDFRCTAVGLECDAGGRRRASVYLSVPGPLELEALLGGGLAPDPVTQQRVRALLGRDPDAPRPWPKTWVAASARAGGDHAIEHKVYLFLRGDPRRRDDRWTLERVGATPALRDVLAALGRATATPWVQLVGLRTEPGQDGAPAWTLYLGSR